MPHRRRRRKKTKFVTRRALPFLLMKNAEPKFREVTSMGLREDVNTANFINYELSAVTQGVTQNTRIGNMIQITGVHFQCGFADGTLTDITDIRYARVIIYTSRIATASELQVRPFVYPDKEKYIIWADKTVPLGYNNTLPNSMITIRKKFRPYMKCLFDESVLNTVEKNPVRVMISSNALSTNSPSVIYQSRLYFRDI